jgi:hypothetical protein
LLNSQLEQIVPIAIDWMNTDNRYHRRKVPDFLHAITDDDFEELGKVLIALYQRNAINEDIFTEILHEYSGTFETESAWKVLIESHPDDEELRKDCIGHFFGTGTTSGLDGIALAYEARYEMFKRWQDDSNETVKQVGIEGAKAFKDAAKRERERRFK